MLRCGRPLADPGLLRVDEGLGEVLTTPTRCTGKAMPILRSCACSDATHELLRFRIGDHSLGSTYRCARPPTSTTHVVLVSMSSARILRCASVCVSTFGHTVPATQPAVRRAHRLTIGASSSTVLRARRSPARRALGPRHRLGGSGWLRLTAVALGLCLTTSREDSNFSSTLPLCLAIHDVIVRCLACTG